MILVKYKIKKKYINILIYNKQDTGILYTEFFKKTKFNLIFMKNSVYEFLYETGLLKIKKN